MPQSDTQTPNQAETKTVSPMPAMAPPLQSAAIIDDTPVFLQPFDFQSKEIASTAASGIIGPAFCVLHIPRSLKKRKLYLWIFTAANNAADNFMLGNVVLGNNRGSIAKIPIAAGISQAAPSVLLESRPCLFTNAANTGTPLQDTINLLVAQPSGIQPASVILNPLYIFGEFDQARVELIEQKNVTDCRLFLGCLSTN